MHSMACIRFMLRFVAVLALVTADTRGAFATAPSYEGAQLPQAYLDRLAANPRAFQFQRALLATTERAAIVRRLSSQPQIVSGSGSSALAGTLSSALGGTATTAPPDRIQGRRNIPVILIDFLNSGTRPFTPADLKKELFDGPWPTGTLTQYYREISSGVVEVRGTVGPWVKLSKPAAFYEGADYVDAKGKLQHCFGLCPKNAKIGELIKEALEANKTFDWRPYDNDGPDDQPNTGDDDGFVDFVAFVHAGKGGECGGVGNTNIWSHRGSLTLNLGVSAHVTTSKRSGGGFIKIDDYVVLPALGCDGSTMIPIGVIAHEFGHAFGLPDLYDTNGKSSGLGNWDLMATGSYGGDGSSPSTPSHMSAWSKQFLGWIDVEDVVGDHVLDISAIEQSKTAFRFRVSKNMYYLVSATNRSGFNSKLPASGLMILQVNETVVSAGLRSNTVNADPDNLGVRLVEADGLDRLKAEPFRGDASSVFPGATGNRSFDNSARPAAVGKVAVCSIPDPTEPMRVLVSSASPSCDALVAAFGSPSAPLAAAAPAAVSAGIPRRAPAPAPATASSSKAGPAGTAVVIHGTLLNLGSNYFDRKSRRIVLRNERGEEVDLTTSLPLSATPGAVRPAAGTLNDYLDKKVEIRGVVVRPASGGSPATVHANDLKIIQ